MSLSEKLGINKGNLVALIIIAAAVIYGLVNTILSWVKGAIPDPFMSIMSLIIYALIIFFAVWGYKIPNGKMLKYVFLLFALKLGIGAGVYAAFQSNIPFILSICAVIITAFVGGRLPRVKENMIFNAILSVLILATCIITSIAIKSVMFGSFIQSQALIAAYQSRAAQYKVNSGILDDK